MNTHQLAVHFMYKYAQSQTAQRGDLQKALEDAKLFSWNDISANVFKLLDKLEYQGKFDGNIIVSPAGAVQIQIIGNNPKNPQVQQGLQNLFAPQMTNVLKKAQMKPVETMTVPWLSQVG